MDLQSVLVLLKIDGDLLKVRLEFPLVRVGVTLSGRQGLLPCLHGKADFRNRESQAEGSICIGFYLLLFPARKM